MCLAEQGPLDWLVPFIPPVLRVNCETRAKIKCKVAHLVSKETVRSIGFEILACWRYLAVFSVIFSVWMAGLFYIYDNEREFAMAYIITSGFALIGCHLLIGDEGRSSGISAYSVFNRGTLRMMGSLSAEQFENEIRHRNPENSNPHLIAEVTQEHHDELNDEGDIELVAAIKLSLQEYKRADRRIRRTSHRRE
ncbi:hypothetical protein CCR75_005339 [Bremia lactucae]|uniref:SAYSvFN domain-containing protein n=1 Tax=Bremia lactucae TaxID=4779 RepID=A0A976ICY9_BRELC|nr:hypothetical protein CCR75_005339 [Bremia lactucae]